MQRGVGTGGPGPHPPAIGLTLRWKLPTAGSSAQLQPQQRDIFVGKGLPSLCPSRCLACGLSGLNDGRSCQPHPLCEPLLSELEVQRQTWGALGQKDPWDPCFSHTQPRYPQTGTWKPSAKSPRLPSSQHLPPSSFPVKVF